MSPLLCNLRNKATLRPVEPIWGMMTVPLVRKCGSAMKTALVIGVLVALLAAALVFGIVGWNLDGADVTISAHGILALVLGGIGTLALGGGLMFLVFYSNRRGYDDAVDDRYNHTGNSGNPDHARSTRGPHGTWTRYGDPPT
jgi:hypothetical protein